MKRVSRVAVLTVMLVVAVFAGVSNAAAGWGQQTAISNRTLWDIHFVDSSHGWAVGNDGLVLATTNGGGSWTPQPTPATDENLFSVSFVDTSYGWAVGTNGLIIATNNGGASWSVRTSGTTETLNAVSFVDASRGWVVGDTETILATSNGGLTWTAQESPRNGTIPLYDVTFTDASHGWAVGSGAWIIRTTNGGATWSDDGAPSVKQTDFISRFRAVSFPDRDHGWAVADGGVIYATFDRGLNWRKQTSPTTLDLWDLMMVDASHGWAVGYNGLIIRTETGGDAWTIENAADVSRWDTLSAVAFTDTGHGWALGGVGTLRRYLDPPSTGTLSASPGSGVPGTVISIRSITACPADSTYVIMTLLSGSGARLSSGRAANFGASGSWSGTLTVPSSAATGPAFVTATCYGTSERDIRQEYSYASFTIDPVLRSISVTPANPTIPQDATRQFTATGTFSDGSTRVLSSVSWESSDSTVAPINTTGLATGVAVGQTTITARSGDVGGFTTLTVTQGRPTITSFSPASGRAGTRVTITGTHLSGVTAVAFNGTAASFTIQSDTEITTKVPRGATTGPITVTALPGVGTSATNFVVKR